MREKYIRRWKYAYFQTSRDDDRAAWPDDHGDADTGQGELQPQEDQRRHQGGEQVRRKDMTEIYLGLFVAKILKSLLVYEGRGGDQSY